MDTLQCAVILAKLERFEWEVERRLEIGARYDSLLADMPAGAALLANRADRTNVHAQYTISVPVRDALQSALKETGIPTAVHYPVPMHLQPAYASYCCPECCPVSNRMAERVMSLPMSADLDHATQDRIVATLRATLTQIA